jgi:hypothetical protein
VRVADSRSVRQRHKDELPGTERHLRSIVLAGRVHLRDRMLAFYGLVEANERQSRVLFPVIRSIPLLTFTPRALTPL